jgi:GMP synthase (glutamine-hydrolysing)
MKPFLILQLRPIDAASDNEFEAFLQYGKLTKNDVHRVRMEKEGVPELNLDNYSGIIIGGGPSNVSDSDEEKYVYQRKFEQELDTLLKQVFQKDFPLLGTCYGIGALVKYRGGKVAKGKYSEDVGAVNIHLNHNAETDDLTKGLPKKFKAYVGHKEACQELPENAVLLASSASCPIQMIRFGKNIYATQFHTELDEVGICVRIDIYKNDGYFLPEEAEELKQLAENNHVTIPELILHRFIQKYKQEL